ncbi:hypothetical protein CLV59_11398 [Chitinophaga dinghuensis]|uniref:Uncharacterized protein n=1 Tax=Chitinophaga dinghuensis TaxID=1539050 RepID=A0A327VK34_9BACT|nr:hypothetical protein [Chitinophaga dinghuensis]RAJ73545.1 hypothetical protein CLV59_11398 [Chitinophaga dinghuensis]
MNLFTYKPALLLQDKFVATDLKLSSYNQSELWQEWKNSAYFIQVCYSSDFEIIQATNSITVTSITDIDYYFRYSKFIPAIIDEKNKDGKSFFLFGLSEDLLAQTFTQTWVFDEDRVVVVIDENYEVLHYEIREQKDGLMRITPLKCQEPAPQYVSTRIQDEKEQPILSDFLREVVGDRGLTIFDGECISGAADYVEILNDLKTLTDPVIEVADIKIEDHRSIWKIALSINGIAHDFTVKGDTDWFDENFIRQINVALRASGSAHTFYAVTDEDYGQGFGVVYLHNSLAACITAYLKTTGLWEEWEGIDNLLDYSSSRGTY